MKSKNLAPLSQPKLLETTPHQKWGGVGQKGFAYDFSGKWKPETGNSFVFIYPKTWDIAEQRSYTQLDLETPMNSISQNTGRGRGAYWIAKSLRVR
jgi:hypothetical protein